MLYIGKRFTHATVVKELMQNDFEYVIQSITSWCPLDSSSWGKYERVNCDHIGGGH